MSLCPLFLAHPTTERARERARTPTVAELAQDKKTPISYFGLGAANHSGALLDSCGASSNIRDAAMLCTQQSAAVDTACLQLLGYHEGILELLDDIVQSFFPHHPVLDEHAFQVIPRHSSRPELPPWCLHCTTTCGQS